VPTETIKGKIRNRGKVSALSAGAYTTILYVMVDKVKGDGRAPPPLSSPAWAYPHDGMYARKWPLLLCVLCACVPYEGKVSRFEREVLSVRTGMKIGTFLFHGRIRSETRKLQFICICKSTHLRRIVAKK
jgi:hypothetical protein